MYDNWSPQIPAIFVNYDDAELRRPIEKQIEDARVFLSRYSNQLHAILLKPEEKNHKFIEIERIKNCIHTLRPFHIIGLTEKELGRSLLDRMKNIAEIRIALDDEGIRAPLHIFGSLDPISSPLYFLAGAEIFDGLTWLRFGYQEGLAAYLSNVGALHVGINSPDINAKAWIFSKNYLYLVELQNEMKKFLIDRDFGKFTHNSKFFSNCYDLLKTQVRRLK